MIEISKWYGGFANNLLQIINAITIAKTKQINFINFPEHKYFSTTQIDLQLFKNNHQRVDGLFFDVKKTNSPIEMKEIFHKYIEPIFRLIKESTDFELRSNEITVHLRSGDNFSKNPHSSYVQPPLSFYLKLLDNYNLNLVFEDVKNPCINKLLLEDNVKNMSNSSLSSDLNYLLNSKNLAIGHGTFGFAIYLISKKLENLYIPLSSFQDFPVGKWGESLNIHTIDLIDYIPKGKWKNTFYQRRKMLKYRLKTDFEINQNSK
jgi:hypothetical protein